MQQSSISSPRASAKFSPGNLWQTVGELGRTAYYSFVNHWRLLVISYTLVGLGLALATIAGYIQYDLTLYYFMDVLDGGGRFGAGLVTAFSTMCFVLTGALFILTARALLASDQESRQPSAAWWWIVAGIGLIYLGMDELMKIHEELTVQMQKNGVPKLFGAIEQDFYIVVIYAIVTLWLGTKLAPAIWQYRRSIFPLIMMLAFFVLSQAVDFIPWDAMTGRQKAVFGPLEEIFKTVGTWSAVLYGVLLLEEVTAQRFTKP